MRAISRQTRQQWSLVYSCASGSRSASILQTCCASMLLSFIDRLFPNYLFITSSNNVMAWSSHTWTHFQSVMKLYFPITSADSTWMKACHSSLVCLVWIMSSSNKYIHPKTLTVSNPCSFIIFKDYFLLYFREMTVHRIPKGLQSHYAPVEVSPNCKGSK